jgi:TRAP-type mannitol/chloroaromatic compound transport system substrate-binding protein
MKKTVSVLKKHKGNIMKRREFIKTSGLAGAALGSSVLAAPAVHAGSTIHWKMVTSWPKNFPGLGTGANFLAKLIGEMSGGRLMVKVYGAKELVPALEVFDAVYDGTAEMGHSGAYYWKGKSEATQFFSAVRGDAVFFCSSFWSDSTGNEWLALSWRRHGTMDRTVRSVWPGACCNR